MLGEELRNARLAAGLTQEALAARAGLDRAYISLLEHDRKSPTLDTLFRLCKAIGISAAAVVGRVEAKRHARK
jgi:transcriptional regulator with XRE-family HTH domain